MDLRRVVGSSPSGRVVAKNVEAAVVANASSNGIDTAVATEATKSSGGAAVELGSVVLGKWMICG